MVERRRVRAEERVGEGKQLGAAFDADLERRVEQRCDVELLSDDAAALTEDQSMARRSIEALVQGGDAPRDHFDLRPAQAFVVPVVELSETGQRQVLRLL